LVCGALLASPVLLLQLWRFIAPGLYHHEKKALLIFAVISSFCFLGGGLFGYLVVFPPAFRFLIGYSNSYLFALPTVSEYFSLSLRLLLAFGMVFELPVLLVFLGRLGVIDVAFLRRNRKYAILIAFIVAAILTPTPDVVNQIMMGGPLVILYEIGIVAVRIFVRSPPEKTAASGDGTFGRDSGV
jgi:sec-independent protein translocase protein TatC